MQKSIYERLPFYYGWVIFVLTLLIYTVMYGLRYSIGIFFTPIQREFGWSTTATASVVTAFFWVYAISAPFIGKLAERINVRKTVALGGLLLGAGGALISLTSELWHLYLFWGVVAPVGASALYVIPTMGLSRFFEKRRGIAVGWASIGVSIGQAILVPYAAFLTSVYGWRTAVFTLGLTVLLVASLLGYVFFKESPEEIGLEIDGNKHDPTKTRREEQTERESESSFRTDLQPREALKTGSCRLILISYFFQVGGVISILTFAVPHMINIGINPIQAGGAFSLIGAASAIGSFVFGIVSDKIGRKKTIMFTTAGISASFFMASVIPPNITLLYAWAMIYGLIYGGCPEQYAAITADYYGRRYAPTIFGFLTLAGGIGGGLFPLIGGYLVDMTGNYYTTLKFLGAGMLAATLTILSVKHPTKR